MNYASVKNTAMNGQLIRAEVRELILAVAIQSGFGSDNSVTTILPLDVIFNNNCSNLKKLSFWVLETLKVYFPYGVYEIKREPYNCNAVSTVFHDSKKLNIYANRMFFGKDKQYRLDKHTMQYLWTMAPLAYWYSNSEHLENELDFSDFAVIKYAYDKEENMRAIQQYIKDVCKIDSIYNPVNNIAKLFFLPDDYEQLDSFCRTESLRLKQKFYDGCYITLYRNERLDIMEDYDYGKKTREQIRALVSRKNKENQSPA